MAGQHGGRRPGAGRKSTKDAAYQASMRDIVRDIVTPDEWRKVLLVRLSFALAGNADAYRDLEKWVMGKVPDETKLLGDADAPLEIVIKKS